MAHTPSERLAELGLTLPAPPRPAGSYAPVLVEGNLAWVSGQIVARDGTVLFPGKVDTEVSASQAHEVARLATLQGLSALADTLGSVDRIRRVVRVGVYVASSPAFTQQHEVGNGATELLIELFEQAGRSSRASVGVTSLPLNAPVEVEMVVAFD